MDKDDELFKKKQEIERKLKNEWLAQKREYERQEEDNRHDYQSIMKEIKDQKTKTRKLNKDLEDKQKQVKNLRNEQETLKV